MKYWIRLLALVFCVVLIIAIIGSLFPHDYSFETSREVSASPQQVYQQIDSLPKWKNWSQWNPETVESLTIEYGADGKSQHWTDVRGEGKLWFTDQQENQQIDYELRFANFPKMTSSLTLTPKGDSTLVTWKSQGVLPAGAFYGFFRHIFVHGMKTEYEASLDRLTALAEEQNPESSQTET